MSVIKLAVPATQIEKERAVNNIRDYYVPPTCFSDQKFHAQFEDAKKQYVAAIERELIVAKSIAPKDVFPKYKSQEN